MIVTIVWKIYINKNANSGVAGVYLESKVSVLTPSNLYMLTIYLIDVILLFELCDISSIRDFYRNYSNSKINCLIEIILDNFMENDF